MAERLRLPMTRLSRIAHLNRNTMTAHPASPTVQAKLGEIARIITRAAELAGDEGRAIIWFRHQPIPGFGKTAEELVEEGKARSEEHTSELQSLMRISYAVFCLKKKKTQCTE